MKKLIYAERLLIILLLILCTAAIATCSSNARTAQSNLTAAADTVAFYKNSLGNTTARIKTLQLTKEQMQEQLLHKDAQLKALAKEYTAIVHVVKHNAAVALPVDPVIYHDTVPCVFKKQGTVSNKWYAFNYISDQKGIAIDTFKTWTTATVITGYKRKWLLGKETLVTDVTYSNPYINVTTLTAGSVAIPVPWYKKWYVWLLTGVVSGALLAR